MLTFPVRTPKAARTKQIRATAIRIVESVIAVLLAFLGKASHPKTWESVLK
jgi:hypothetical protein